MRRLGIKYDDGDDDGDDDDDDDAQKLDDFFSCPRNLKFISVAQSIRRGKRTDTTVPRYVLLYRFLRRDRSGLDVDKLDYFQRDARNSVGARALDIDRFIDLARHAERCCRLTPVSVSISPGTEFAVHFSAKNEMLGTRRAPKTLTLLHPPSPIPLLDGRAVQRTKNLRSLPCFAGPCTTPLEHPMHALLA